MSSVSRMSIAGSMRHHTSTFVRTKLIQLTTTHHSKPLYNKMKLALFASLLTCSAAFSPAFTMSRSQQLSTMSSPLTKQFMFGGDGGGEIGDEEQEAQIEAAAKQMGFSPGEYKLVLKMQQQLADSVNTMRCTAGSDVKVTMDGNSPPAFLEIEVGDDVKGQGAAAVEKAFISAFKDAANESKKGQAEAVQNMNKDIAEEMKKMGVGQ